MNQTREQTVILRMLRQLNTPAHRIGHHQLLVGISHYADDPTQSITKELYPYVARECGCGNPRSVEHSIRELIRWSWNHRDPKVWDSYFHGAVKAPSNKQFIAVLAYRLNTLPDSIFPE